MVVFRKLCRTALSSRVYKTTVGVSDARVAAVSYITGLYEKQRNIFVHVWSVWSELSEGAHAPQKGEDFD